MAQIKILSGGKFHSFNVVNKYSLSQKEQDRIFKELGVSKFNVTFPTRTHSYEMPNIYTNINSCKGLSATNCRPLSQSGDII